jgi:VWFA-related protein
MNRLKGNIFLRVSLCVVLASACAAAQEIGHQGTDPFTGQPATPVAPVSIPDTKDQRTPAADEEHKLVFRSRSVLVQVPAVVTDKSGAHLHNLTKADFKVLENGKEQKISEFEEITTSGLRLQQTATPPNTFTNRLAEGDQRFSVTVIALDTINTPFLDQSYGRRQVLKYLANTLDSGRTFGLVVIGSKGVKVLGGLNTDPAALIAALKSASGEVSAMETFGAEGRAVGATESDVSELAGPIPMGGADPSVRMRRFIATADALESGYQQPRAIEDTMKAMLAIALSLEGIPGRKSLIWATGSFPFTLDSPASVPGGNLSMLYERTLEALNDAQVSVYPIDVKGLVSTSDAAYSGEYKDTYVSDGGATRNWLQNSSVESLQNFADMTGGKAYYNSNDLASSFRRAADDASSYYLLGYYVDNRSTKPGWRKLQVQVARKDAEVHARTGFLVTNATIDPQLTHKADVDFALSSPFDSTGLEVTVQWQGMAASGDKKKVGFALRLPATGVIDEADKNRFDVDFIAQATRNGAPAANAGQSIKGMVPPASLAKIKAEGIFYNNALELPAGSYQVRFVVRDNLSGRIGSVSAPLTVN